MAENKGEEKIGHVVGVIGPVVLTLLIGSGMVSPRARR